MGVALALMDFDELFYKKATRMPVIVNDFDDTSEYQKKLLNGLIYTTYSGDILTNLPSCECGKLVGEYQLGVVCDNCQTPVTPKIEQELEPIIWIRAPEGLKLINPMVWLILRDHFGLKNFDVMRWICDLTVKAPRKNDPLEQDILRAFKERGIRRGLKGFVDNFDQVMDILFNTKLYRKKGEKNTALQNMLLMYRNCIFSDYLPLPNRALLVIEKSNLGTYIDPIVPQVVNATRLMVGIDSELCTYSAKKKENRAIKMIAQLADFYEDLYRNTLAKKQGIFRKHVFGSRSHFSFRTVISSLTDTHDYDEIHIPWGIAITVFRLHLVNKLMRRHYTPNDAVALLNQYAQRYHPLLDQLLDELIAECPYKGIPAVMQRNPSLERGSAQAVFITKVKKDPSIPTVSISILAVRGLNADFDGDQINFTLSLDHNVTNGLYKLAPHMSTFDLNAPRKVSGNLSMPKPVVATIANWIHNHHTEMDLPDPVKLERMKEIPVLA